MGSTVGNVMPVPIFIPSISNCFGYDSIVTLMGTISEDEATWEHVTTIFIEES